MCKSRSQILVQSYLAQQKPVPGAIWQTQVLSEDQAWNLARQLEAARWVDEYLDNNALPDTKHNIGTRDALPLTQDSSLSSIQEEATEHGQDKSPAFVALMPETWNYTATRNEEGVAQFFARCGKGKSRCDASKSNLKSRVYKTVGQLFSWSSSVRKTVPKILVQDLTKQKEDEIVCWRERELVAEIS